MQPKREQNTFKTAQRKAEEMAQWFRMLDAFAEDWGLVPWSHIGWYTITCNSSSKGSEALFSPLQAPVHNAVHMSS